MKKVIFAASILLVASLAMTGCGAAREQVPAQSAQAATAYVETIPATEAATTQTAAEAVTEAVVPAVPAPTEAAPVETAAPVTTAATTAKPAATTAASTSKPAATTAASTSKPAAATEATLPNPPCPGFEKELAPAPAPATEMAPAPAPEMAPAPAPTQNAIMNFIGSYSNGRAVMTVSANGSDRANIRISWSGSAFETAVWKMSGTVRAIGDCVIVDYTDCFKETFTYTTDGAPLVDAIEYTNGSGSVTFHFSDAIWDDFQENAAEGTVFSYYAD